MLQIFLARYVENKPSPTPQFNSLCKYIKYYWDGVNGIIAPAGTNRKAWDYVGTAYPSNQGFG